MSQQKPGPQSNLPKSNSLNDDIIRQFLENQKAQINLEADSLKLKYAELEANTRLAEKSMEFQAAHLAKQPSEGRRNITRMAYIFGGLILLLFAFIAYCLYLDKETFIVSFLKNAGYVFTTIMGYWFGRRVGKESERKKETDPIEEVEILKQ